jgi:hypothetical protein
VRGEQRNPTLGRPSLAGRLKRSAERWISWDVPQRKKKYPAGSLQLRRLKQFEEGNVKLKRLVVG